MILSIGRELCYSQCRLSGPSSALLSGCGSRRRGAFHLRFGASRRVFGFGPFAFGRSSKLVPVYVHSHLVLDAVSGRVTFSIFSDFFANKAKPKVLHVEMPVCAVRSLAGRCSTRHVIQHMRANTTRYLPEQDCYVWHDNQSSYSNQFCWLGFCCALIRCLRARTMKVRNASAVARPAACSSQSIVYTRKAGCRGN
jgi:hypothetical protein